MTNEEFDQIEVGSIVYWVSFRKLFIVNKITYEDFAHNKNKKCIWWRVYGFNHTDATSLDYPNVIENLKLVCL